MHTLFTHQSTNSSNSMYPLPLLSSSFIAAVNSSSFRLTFCWDLHSTIAHHASTLVQMNVKVKTFIQTVWIRGILAEHDSAAPLTYNRQNASECK